MENELVNSSERNWSKLSKLISRPLGQKFYERHTVEVAKRLLGKILVVRSDAKIIAGRIVETEAYRADDPASHSCRGETPRCSVMFGKPGVAYVYFIYGMYEMLNVVTEPKGEPGAVLIRAVEPYFGIPQTQLVNGPGRLCKAMGVTRLHNKQSLRGPSLYIVDDGYVPLSLSVSRRVGIRLGTEKLWRFFMSNHPCVSKVPENKVSLRLTDLSEEGGG
jgi:DNA-3-methyladenine glycosylase